MRQLRCDAMLISFYGEVQTIRNYLWSAAERCRWCLELGQEPEIQSFRVPDDVFRAHAGSLGEIGDSRLVSRLVEVYAIARSVTETATQLEHMRSHRTAEVIRFLGNLAASLGATIYVDAWLREQTEKHREVSDRINRKEFEEHYGEQLATLDGLQRETESYRQRVARDDSVDQ